MKICDNCGYWCPCCHLCNKKREKTDPFYKCRYYIKLVTEDEELEEEYEKQYKED